jgi:large subunit ribosomal protein L32e
MADEATADAPQKPAARPRRKAAAKPVAPKTADAPEMEKSAPAAPRAPRRATLSAARARLLKVRVEVDRRRPIFGRQAANRYWRIGRDGAWRRPRGLQSKQRRHYGYRAEIVSIGYRSPAAVRGLVPSGFRPIIVRTNEEIERLDARTEAAIVARTVGTRRRLTLEETARKLGVHVLNPIVKPEREE